MARTDSKMKDPDTLLARCPLFRGMSPPGRLELLGLFETRRYAPAETIIVEGESFQWIWILVSGNCQVFKKSEAGHEQELARLEPCDVFGEMSFFQPAPHSASVRALTEVEVMRLSRDKYDMLLRIGSLAAYKLAFNSIPVLIERLRKMDEWVCRRFEKEIAPQQREEWADFQSKLYSGWQF
jgi:CRP/FNR family transcriptional regulator, cyclic AMP receptor protein